MHRRKTQIKSPATFFVAGDELLSQWLYISLVAERFRSRVSAGYKSQHCVDRNNGRTAVADQRQRQTDNGHNADTHADVNGNLENQRGGRTEADQATHIVLTTQTNIDAAGNDGKLQQHNKNAAEETQLLTDGGENVVRMLCKQTAALCTVAVE